jgi:hypothetical protein
LTDFHGDKAKKNFFLKKKFEMILYVSGTKSDNFGSIILNIHYKKWQSDNSQQPFSALAPI